MADSFEDRVRDATGLDLADLQLLGEAQERLRAERIKAAGWCCEAGAVAYPYQCIWHPDRPDNVG